MEETFTDLLARPEPQGLTDEELLKLVAEELGYEPRLQVGPQEVFGTTEEMVGLLRAAIAADRARFDRP
jgi:hypothetical protein